MKILKYMLPAAALLLASCEKEIDFEYHDIDGRQVIEGMLSQEGASVRLTMTVATDEPFTDRTVTDASVTIKDIDEGIAYDLQLDAGGIFTHGSLRGLTGHTYELTVSRGNRLYTSASRMLAPTEIVSAEFNWIKMPYDDVAVLKVGWLEDADAETRYWLRVSRNGEPYEWQAIDSRNAVGGIVTGMMMTSRKDTDEEDDDRVLAEGDVIDIEVMPISRAMADYLNSLNSGDYNGNQMFDGAYCLGYFLSAPVARTQLIYHPDQIPYAK